MINVKDEVFQILSGALQNVSDSYPKDWSVLPAVQYVEEDNRVEEWTDNEEQKSYLRYRIDIWDNKNTSEAALTTDMALSKLGLMRIACQDVPDPSGLKHKMMRYEGIVDTKTEMVYQTI